MLKQVSVPPNRICLQQVKPLRHPGPQHRAGLLARQPSEEMENKCPASLPHGKGWGVYGMWNKEAGRFRGVGRDGGKRRGHGPGPAGGIFLQIWPDVFSVAAQSPDPTPAEPLPCMNTLHPPPATSTRTVCQTDGR